MARMIDEYTEAWHELTSPGAPFAMHEIEVRGVPDEVHRVEIPDPRDR